MTTTEKVVKKYCKCNENNEKHNFCPKCGNQNIRTIKETIEKKHLSEYGHYEPYGSYNIKNEYVYIIFSSIDGATSYDEKPVRSRCQDLTVSNEVKEKFIQEVNKIETWNEDNYGLYTFVECNY